MPERQHVAFMNAWHLRDVYCLVRGIEDFGGLPKEIKALKGDELFPGVDNDSWPGRGDTPAAARRTTQECLARLERLAELFRRGLPPGAFELPAYRSRVALVQEAARAGGRTSRVEHDSQFVKLPKGVPVYVVRREFLDYYLIEERGEMRVLFIHIMPDFKWPGL